MQLVKLEKMHAPTENAIETKYRIRKVNKKHAVNRNNQKCMQKNKVASNRNIIQ